MYRLVYIQHQTLTIQLLTCILLTDIDECRVAALNSSVICANDTSCTNSPGSFECECVSGYRLVDGNCERKRQRMLVIMHGVLIALLILYRFC